MQRILLQPATTARDDRGSSARPTRRRGFTLIELMIVIGVIALLMSVIGVVAMSAFGGAKISATKATLAKVQGLLQQRLDAVIRKDPEKTLVDSLVPRFGNRKLAEVMARKFTYRQAFPQTWAEITAYNPGLLTLSSESVPMTTTPAAESAEVLLFLLTRANVLGYPPEGADVFNSTELRDTDGNGKMELVDTWGYPLRFYRWPTRLVRGLPFVVPPGTYVPSGTARAMMPALPTTATELLHDSDDKYGALRVANNSSWRPLFGGYQLPAPQVAYFENGLAPAPSAMSPSPFYQLGAFHTLETTSLPLIISGGADNATGLFEPSDTANFGYLAAPDPSQESSTYDNISNFNIRSGGK